MGKYANTLEELRDTRNFAKLATVYRYLAKFRDGIAAAAPKTPNNALGPTLDHLDKTLKDYRDLASEITGFPVQDSDLRINLGDEVGAAGTPDTGQHAGTDASQIDVLKELAATAPFDEKALTQWDVNSITIELKDAEALYGTAAGGALAIATRADMPTYEAEFAWDSFASIEHHPMVQEARGCVNRLVLGAAATVIGVAVLLGAWVLWPNGGDDDDGGVVGGDTPSAGETASAGLFDAFSDATQRDLSYFFEDDQFDLSVTYVLDDPTDDAFNSFGDVVTFQDELTELVAGYGGRLELSAETGEALTCGGDTGTGMSVVCAEGVSGALPAGDYVVFIGSVERPFENWKATIEYKYSVFVEDRGRNLAFPNGDPRPEFPNNTLIRTNSFMSLDSVGGGTWALNARWSEGQQFRSWPDAPATDNALEHVRGALGGNTFIFIAPSELYSGMTYYNVGTEAHPAGEQYTAENTTQDVLGDNPQAAKPMLYNILPTYEDDDGGSPIAAALREKLAQYAQWNRDGNGDELSGHLDRSAILRWGEERCDGYFSRIAPDPTFALEVLEVRAPEAWDWEIYDIRVGTLFDAYEFDVNLTQGGMSREITGHFAWDDQTEDIRIFSPCVTAEEAAAELAAAQAPAQPPAGTTSPTPAPATGADVDRIRSLLPRYEMARRDGSDDVYDFLHPIVLAYYGEDVCRDFYANQVAADPTFAFGQEQRVSGPAAYTYMPSGVTVGSTDGVYSFVIDTTIGGQTQPFTWRLALVEDQLKVFQPCRR